MTRKKAEKKAAVPPYSISFDINGERNVFRGESMSEVLNQLTNQSVKNLVFKTKLVMTIAKGEKTATQIMNRLSFRRLCGNKMTKIMWAKQFELLVQ